MTRIGANNANFDCFIRNIRLFAKFALNLFDNLARIRNQLLDFKITVAYQSCIDTLTFKGATIIE